MKKRYFSCAAKKQALTSVEGHHNSSSLSVERCPPIEKQVKAAALPAKKHYKYCTPYDLTARFIAKAVHWNVSSVNDSSIADVSTFNGAIHDGAVVIELMHPDRYVTDNALQDVYFVRLSNAAPEYCEVTSWCANGGIELNTFTLPTTSGFRSHVSTVTCLNLLLACQIAIKASTKLSQQDKQRVLKQIKRDHGYMLNFIKRIPKSPNKSQKAWLQRQIPKVTDALLANSRHYWSIIQRHSITDFKFKHLSA